MYYFKQPHLMVSGRVQPPRLDLANEDLVRSHVQALWLAETGRDLGRSVAEVLSLGQPGYPVRPELTAGLKDPDARRRAAKVARAVLQPLVPDLEQMPWWGSAWVDEVSEGVYDAFDRACQRWRDLYGIAETERKSAEATAGDASATRKEREEADRRRFEARQRMELLLNETDESGQSDFYTYRYLASEGFLPGYSFPRLPLAAYVPGTRGRGNTWLQRPRFLAISEFGPGALIYHEGARYQVSRINLARTGDSNGPADVVRTEARVCDACGYHHARAVGTDVCEQCSVPLPAPYADMLQMQTVVTRRRERISADEEERNRVGFELLTTYRFLPRGDRPGRLIAEVIAADTTPVAELSYGDSAEIRVINLGRKRRKYQEVYGFYLDLVRGRWLGEKEGDAQTQPGEDDDLEKDVEDVKRKARVIPYVEDRRNILVVRWAEAVSEVQAWSLQYALERGIEATFELEDSELLSERLPDNEGRGRFLLVEAAEGGAGVLRRLQAEDDALSRAAAEALRIIHVDPATGEETDDACVRGCYHCLLSYGNQLVHEKIDRRLAVDTLRAVAAGRTVRDESAASTGSAAQDQEAHDLDGRAAELLEVIRQAGGRRPDRVGAVVDGVRVDMVYEGAVVPTAVIVDDPAKEQDVSALTFGVWNVVRVKPDDDIGEVVKRHLQAFTEGAQ
jgi:hypothetical protein